MKKILLHLILFNFQAKGQKALLFESASIIDGTGKSLIQGYNVLVVGDSIHSILKEGEDVPVADYQIIDLTGKYLLPGLFDAHVHFATDPSEGDQLEKVKQKLKIMLQNGVTGVRDMAGDTRQLAYLDRQTELDEIIAPTLYFSSLMAGASFFDDPRTIAAGRGRIPGKTPWMKAITDDTDIVLAVAEAKGTGASGIKLYADLLPHLAMKVIKEAHRQDFLVWAHAAVIPTMPSDLIEAGIDGISHGPLLAWEAAAKRPTSGKQRYNEIELDVENESFKNVIQKMAENQVYLDPTVFIYKDRYARAIYNNGLIATKAAFDAEVPLVIGTDQGFDADSFTYLPLIDEMDALVNEAGIPALAILKAATLNAANFLRIGDKVGSIEVGKKANLLLLDANPLDDIMNLKKVNSVYKNGKKVTTN